jgi:hypothetical protein
MARRQFSPLRLLANHAGMALVFSWSWHALIYAVIWVNQGLEQADRARANWFIWQTMWAMMLYWAAAGGFTAYRAVQRARQEAAASAQAQAQALLAFTRAYLDLEALRLGHRLQVQWEVDDAALGLAVPALSVQPLVENCFEASTKRAKFGRA